MVDDATHSGHVPHSERPWRRHAHERPRAHGHRHSLLEVLVDRKVEGPGRPEKEIARINVGLRDAGITPRYVFRASDNGIVGKALDPPIEPRMILIALRERATLLPAAQQVVRIAKLECRKRLSRPAR